MANTEALDQIRALGKNAKIKVVSIGGVARQGKSTLLELLSGASGAFRAADGTEPCTQGIHMLVKRKDDRSNEYLVRGCDAAIALPCSNAASQCTHTNGCAQSISTPYNPYMGQ